MGFPSRLGPGLGRVLLVRRRFLLRCRSLCGRAGAPAGQRCRYRRSGVLLVGVVVVMVQVVGDTIKLVVVFMVFELVVVFIVFELVVVFFVVFELVGDSSKLVVVFFIGEIVVGWVVGALGASGTG